MRSLWDSNFALHTPFPKSGYKTRFNTIPYLII